MSRGEIITIMVLFHLSGFGTFKHFYIYYVQKHMQEEFPKTIDDKGYIGQQLMQMLFVDGIYLVTQIRNNMKNSLMTMADKTLLRKRSVIETVNNKLKNICQIEHSRHRSFGNFITNLVSALIVYSFLPKKPSIKFRTVATNQLSMF